MKKRYIIGIILIIIGVLLFTIPSIIDYNNNKNDETEKNELLKEVVSLIETTDFENNEITSDTNTTDVTKPTEPKPYKPYRTSTNEEIDGILYIDCIDLELPILTNLTEKGLNKTCARVTNTEPPGCNNYCVMGHHNKNYGVLFNRLKEVKKGDRIRVKASNGTFEYEVTETFVTEGLDHSILQDVKDKKVITIFCCDYRKNNGRLVVRGELING